MTLPPLLPKKPRRSSRVRCEAHLRWIRKHACCVPGCDGTIIEAAHVRVGTDGSMGEKPSDKWAISLCWQHHRISHSHGEMSFESDHNLDLKALAEEFAQRSPYRKRLEGK